MSETRGEISRQTQHRTEVINDSTRTNGLSFTGLTRDTWKVGRTLIDLGSLRRTATELMTLETGNGPTTWGAVVARLNLPTSFFQSEDRRLLAGIWKFIIVINKLQQGEIHGLSQSVNALQALL